MKKNLFKVTVIVITLISVLTGCKKDKEKDANETSPTVAVQGDTNATATPEITKEAEKLETVKQEILEPEITNQEKQEIPEPEIEANELEAEPNESEGFGFSEDDINPAIIETTEEAYEILDEQENIRDITPRPTLTVEQENDPTTSMDEIWYYEEDLEKARPFEDGEVVDLADPYGEFSTEEE